MYHRYNYVQKVEDPAATPLGEAEVGFALLELADTADLFICNPPAEFPVLVTVTVAPICNSSFYDNPAAYLKFYLIVRLFLLVCYAFTGSGYIGGYGSYTVSNGAFVVNSGGDGSLGEALQL